MYCVDVEYEKNDQPTSRKMIHFGYYFWLPFMITLMALCRN